MFRAWCVLVCPVYITKSNRLRCRLEVGGQGGVVGLGRTGTTGAGLWHGTWATATGPAADGEVELPRGPEEMRLPTPPPPVANVRMMLKEEEQVGRAGR